MSKITTVGYKILDRENDTLCVGDVVLKNEYGPGCNSRVPYKFVSYDPETKEVEIIEIESEVVDRKIEYVKRSFDGCETTITTKKASDNPSLDSYFSRGGKPIVAHYNEKEHTFDGVESSGWNFSFRDDMDKLNGTYTTASWEYKGPLD